MSSLAEMGRSFVRSVSSLLNAPIIEQNIKDYAGIATAIFGCLEIHDFFSEKNTSTTWIERSSRFSLILSAATTPVAIMVYSVAIERFVSNQFLASTFGPNTIFAINPWHPRHVLSFVAVGCAFPTIVAKLSKFVRNLFNQSASVIIEKETNEDKFLNAERVKFMVIFNFMTSRPALHLGNQLVKSILNRG